MNLTPVEPGNRIQLPADWMQSLGLHDLVALERTKDGILIRPCPRATWDDVFSTRLTVRAGDPNAPFDITEISGDDLLF